MVPWVINHSPPFPLLGRRLRQGNKEDHNLCNTFCSRDSVSRVILPILRQECNRAIISPDSGAEGRSWHHADLDSEFARPHRARDRFDSDCRAREHETGGRVSSDLCASTTTTTEPENSLRLGSARCCYLRGGVAALPGVAFSAGPKLCYRQESLPKFGMPQRTKIGKLTVFVTALAMSLSRRARRSQITPASSAIG